MNVEAIAVMVEDFQSRVKNDAEWLQTTEGHEVECISLENLEGIIKQITGLQIKLS